MLGVIGGSGFEKFDGFETLAEQERETPFGLASSGFKKVRLGEHQFLFLSRHGAHHELLPSEVNYRANIFALKRAGAKAVLSFSAVGSLEHGTNPGDLVVPYQYLDRTKSRAHTFLGEGLIGHVSLAKPICEVMAEGIKSVANTLDFRSHFEKTYVCIEGPYFSTRAESKVYRQNGAHIIGMTNFPEYALAREAGLPYAPCCFVTDFDCWDDTIEHVTVDAVIQVMRQNQAKAFRLLKGVLALGEFYSHSYAYEGGLRTGLFMDPTRIPEEKRALLDVLTRLP